eukprot:jgi/Orpsp1_1/1183572/evm.model.c7180000085771.1
MIPLRRSKVVLLQKLPLKPKVLKPKVLKPNLLKLLSQLIPNQKLKLLKLQLKL